MSSQRHRTETARRLERVVAAVIIALVCGVFAGIIPLSFGIGTAIVLIVVDLAIR